MIENPFVNQSRDMQSTIALIVREASEECDASGCPVHVMLEHCAQQAVEQIWDSRIKTFVPLLGLRTVRGCIRKGHCEDVTIMPKRIETS